MCDCTKYHPCSCHKQERPEYKIGQKWLTKYYNVWEIIGYYNNSFWVVINNNEVPTSFSKDSMNNHCVNLIQNTIKATVISYKYAKNGTVQLYVIHPENPSNNTVESWYKSAKLGRVIILDEKEIELKCE